MHSIRGRQQLEWQLSVLQGGNGGNAVQPMQEDGFGEAGKYEELYMDLANYNDL